MGGLLDGHWFVPCLESDPCLYTDGVTSNIYAGSPSTCCCTDVVTDSSNEINSDECTMSTNGSYNPWNYEYCYNKGTDAYCSMIPFCTPDGVTATSEPCSCAGDKVLSTCYSGETCDSDGECCSATAVCNTGAYYVPEAYYFTPCASFFENEMQACKNTDGVTSNYDGNSMSCCCVDQIVDVYNNSDSCWLSTYMDEPWSYSYCYNKGVDAYCSTDVFCSVGIATTEKCSCPGDKLLSTCLDGDTCSTDGECCTSNGECTTGSKDEMYLSTPM